MTLKQLRYVVEVAETGNITEAAKKLFIAQPSLTSAIRELENEYPDLFEVVNNLNDTVWSGKVLDYKTQKLIAIGITASRADPRATKKQIKSAIHELGITKEEIVDVLRVVLLTSGMPAFSKSLQILNSVIATMDE